MGMNQKDNGSGMQLPLFMRGDLVEAVRKSEPMEGIDFDYDWEQDKARWFSLEAKLATTPTYTGTNKGEDCDTLEDSDDPDYR